MNDKDGMFKSVGHTKKSEFPTGIETMASQVPIGCSNLMLLGPGPLILLFVLLFSRRVAGHSRNSFLQLLPYPVDVILFDN